MNPVFVIALSAALFSDGECNIDHDFERRPLRWTACGPGCKRLVDPILNATSHGSLVGTRRMAPAGITIEIVDTRSDEVVFTATKRGGYRGCHLDVAAMRDGGARLRIARRREEWTFDVDLANRRIRRHKKRIVASTPLETIFVGDATVTTRDRRSFEWGERVLRPNGHGVIAQLSSVGGDLLYTRLTSLEEGRVYAVHDGKERRVTGIGGLSRDLVARGDRVAFFRPEGERWGLFTAVYRDGRLVDVRRLRSAHRPRRGVFGSHRVAHPVGALVRVTNLADGATRDVVAPMPVGEVLSLVGSDTVVVLRDHERRVSWFARVHD